MAKKAIKNTSDKVVANETSNSNPLFYKNIEVLNKDNHSKLKVKTMKNFSFAKEANSVVLCTSEFPAAAASYPIVFATSGDSIVPYAVTGYRDGENTFIDNDGQWKPDTYIPAYIRRYPFILASSEDGKSLSLCIDVDCDAVNQKSGSEIYKDGKPSELAENALKFCGQYRNELERTSEMMKQLQEADILVERSANVQIAGEKPSKVVGFQVVDEQKLNKLEDEVFLKMRKSGLLTLVYCHLWSMRSWDDLIKDWSE